ncbi:MAG: 30S ribosomal protein S18 [Deltaproteobacteria bacterium]|nr:MAG: 30S ribosomal protein S18 [Deltaproteobacteria bacterium]
MSTGDAPRSYGRSGDRPERSGGRFGDRDRERAPQTVKGRLRAKARKKARKKAKKMFNRRKMCRFCADSNILVDYKDPRSLKFFITETGKMIPRRISGNCARHQRLVRIAIKRGRHLALMPYSTHQI